MGGWHSKDGMKNEEEADAKRTQKQDVKRDERRIRNVREGMVTREWRTKMKRQDLVHDTAVNNAEK